MGLQGFGRGGVDGIVEEELLHRCPKPLPEASEEGFGDGCILKVIRIN